jgi:ketosteroid isomerase-like protein
MKQLLFIAAIISVIACNQNKTEAKKISVEEQSAAFKKIVDEKNALAENWYKAGNIDSLVPMFADNVVQLPPNQPATVGIENFRKGWAQSFAWGTWNFSIKASEVKANGDLGVELGKYTLSFEPNETSPIPAIKDTGNYVVHWQKINNDWKIVWDAPVSTVPLPMPSSK